MCTTEKNYGYTNGLLTMRVSQGFWGTREHEPIFREQEEKTVQIRGRKHFDIRNKERYFWDFIYGHLCPTVIGFITLHKRSQFFCVLRA